MAGSRIVQRFENWLQRGSIQSQTGRIFNLFALLVLILGAVATVGTIRIEQRSSALSNLTDVAFLTAQMTRQVTLSKDNMGAYRARGYDAETIALSIEQARSAVEMNKQLRKSAASLDPEFIQQVAELDAGLRNIETLLIEVRDAPRSMVEQESFLGPRYDALDTTIADVVAVREKAATQVAEHSGEGLTQIHTLIAALLVGVIAALGLVMLGKKIVSRRVVEPIARISSVSEQIAAGETDHDIPGSTRDDEIGTLAKALNVLRQVQHKAAEEAQLQHDRELSRQRDIEEEREEQRRKQSALLKSLADQFEKTVSDVATEVAATSDQMHSAAVELAGHVDASSSTVSEANDNLKQASAGITGAASATDEFAMSITEVSRQATSSSERARKAAEAASKADETVAGLTNSADRISQIIEVIAGIAQRTNLLALNASIEAARGGEAGRGFAVVASEVKELAVQTARATEEVEVLIRDMQASTGESATALGQIAEEVVALESTAIAIATAVDQQAVAGQDLARSIDLAARNTATVSATIDDVSQVSMTSGTTAAQVRESSANLSQQSTKLREQVSQFLQQVRVA
ncbi:methyl-accepting chemotaxis protein [uncultured Erythrobacter sp.]|uniref:methyl-accepting chemotaxis protein n=1 Tax=uncultured Erythrobacter sp. TaxID=263913 RepID=UPI002622201B|nr:methyl-accepting chemotaxis protein [uncultured Erythrobacter sp.]